MAHHIHHYKQFYHNVLSLEHYTLQSMNGNVRNLNTSILSHICGFIHPQTMISEMSIWTRDGIIWSVFSAIAIYCTDYLHFKHIIVHYSNYYTWLL
jgi:hypothetical protein